MVLIRESATLLAMGLAFGLAFGSVRGFPSIKPPPTQVGACVAPVPKRPSIQWITQSDARSKMTSGGVTFVDARPREVFQNGHIPGALNVPFAGGNVPKPVIDMLGKSSLVVTYCDTTSECASSRRLANELAAAGLRDVRVLEGGMPAWLKNQYPAEAGACRLCP